MGKLNKTILKQFIENNCERQLFISLARDSDEWLRTNRPIKKLTSINRGPAGLAAKLGKKYEQEIYASLRNLPQARFSTTPLDEISGKLMRKEEFDELYDLLNDDLQYLLIEHGFRIPESFIRSIFKLGNDEAVPLDFDQPVIYPDLLLLERKEQATGLNSDGTVSKLSVEDCRTRIGINIFDVKKTPEENVNKNYFIEIIYYGIALSHFIEFHGLADRYYVNIDGNGILPGLDRIQLYSIDQLRLSIVKLQWNDIHRLYNKATDKIYSLWNKTKCDYEDIDTNIKTMCGRCTFYDDCMDTEGANGSPADMMVKLIPYTSTSTAEQLKLEGIETLKQLIDKIDDIPILSTPKPLYAEIPLLKLKSRSLLAQTEKIPDPGDHLSMAIPKFDNVSIVMNFEEDPLHSRAFGCSIMMNISIGPGAPFYKKYEEWNAIWKDYFDNNLDTDDLSDRFEYDLEIRPNRRHLQELIKILKFFRREKALFRLKGEEYTNKKGETKVQESTWMNFSFAIVNEGLTDETEYEFTKTAIVVFYNVIRYATFLEQYVNCIKKYEDREFIVYPVTAVYYWSREIVEIFENLLQRHIKQLFMDTDLTRELNYLINWATPSESMVKDEVQLRKIFDLRRFVETTHGLPYRINYTWHGIYSQDADWKVNSQYFSPHFNYMDHNNWYQFLEAKDTSSDIILKGRLSKSERRAQIKQQLKIKTSGINQIRQKYQRESRSVISDKNRRPARNFELDRNKLQSSYHDISRIWYLYSKLSGAHSEISAAEFRHYYPQFSIGKLAAGQISNISCIVSEGPRSGKKCVYQFDLTGLSTNMKVKPGDMVLLLPNEERDFVGNQRKWEVAIDTMIWDETNDLVSITTVSKSTTCTVFEYYRDEYNQSHENTSWYIYHTGGEYWSRKLETLLGTNNLGASWLGHRLAYLWGISTKPIAPCDQTFNASELYMYHPGVVNSFSTKINENLLTTVRYPPNDSQHRAIVNSMRHVISSIQGPPGTGKSQTIVALIDEFILRNHRAPKILITSFSYQALHVIIDKIMESEDVNGDPTRVAMMDRIYLRSSHKEMYRGTQDLVRTGRATWRLNDETRKFTKKKKMKLVDYFPDGFIMFGVAHQIFRMRERNKGGYNPLIDDDFAFDLIIVDEASQMPVDQLLASIVLIHQFKASVIGEPLLNKDDMVESVEYLNHMDYSFDDVDQLTKLVLVGDNYQLPPVQPVPPPKNLKNILGSLFSYYIELHGIPNQPLEINYRSHEIIVEYTKRLGFYDTLAAHVNNAKDLLPGDLSRLPDDYPKLLINPQRVVGTIIHDHRFETAVSVIEAQMVVDLVLAYYTMRNPQGKEAQLRFFLEEIGVVAPHNAHGRMIIRRLYDELNANYPIDLDDNDLMNALGMTIFSVEKFQGSDRNFIIASIGISSVDQLSAEEEFIFEINRFNVLSSRAKNKMILICSRNFLEFFPDNRDVMAHASKIKDYAFEYCNKNEYIDVECEEHGIFERIEFRYRDQL